MEAVEHDFLVPPLQVLSADEALEVVVEGLESLPQVQVLFWPQLDLLQFEDINSKYIYNQDNDGCKKCKGQENLILKIFRLSKNIYLQ